MKERMSSGMNVVDGGEGSFCDNCCVTVTVINIGGSGPTRLRLSTTIDAFELESIIVPLTRPSLSFSTQLLAPL